MILLTVLKFYLLFLGTLAFIRQIALLAHKVSEFRVRRKMLSLSSPKERLTFLIELMNKRRAQWQRVANFVGSLGLMNTKAYFDQRIASLNIVIAYAEAMLAVAEKSDERQSKNVIDFTGILRSNSVH